jgi:predicted XRE-type DNA-binding protein
MVETIAELLARGEVSQQEAARLVSLTQPQISRLMRGDAGEFSYERLMRVLTALGQEVEITIRQTRRHRKRDAFRSSMTCLGAPTGIEPLLGGSGESRPLPNSVIY